MTISLGTVPASTTIYIPFATYGKTNGESITMTGLAVTDIEIYKNGSATQRASDAGYTLLDTDGIDFDGLTGIHGFSIDLSDNTDAGFYAVGSWYWVVVSSVTVDSQTVNFIAATFRIGPAESVTGYPKADVSHWLGTACATPTTNGVPEVDVTHWGGTAVASAYVQANTVQFAGQTITCAGGVTIPAATLASTANITAAAGCVLADSSSDAIIADAVWNAATASYGTSGTYGEALEAVGAAADPWLTNLPGAYGSGTAGYIIGTNLNATVSSRSSQTSVDTIDDFLDTEMAAVLAAVDTEVAAIKAKTDNLPASPAAVGSAMTLANDSITADAVADTGANEIADALLNRNMATGSDSGSETTRTVRQALRFLRNKWGVSGTTLTVYKEDDTAASWTATVTTDAAANPITANDPTST